MISLPNFDESFTGRIEALNEFSSLLTKHRQQNAIYYYGKGGIGKSWLFARIRKDWHDPSRRYVTKILDFYDSRNKSVQGIMESVVDELSHHGDSSYFASFYNALEDLRKISSTLVPSPGLLAIAHKKLEADFFTTCNEFAHGKYFILLFDTFESVQFRDVGRWFLNKFVPSLQNFTIVFAGRPPEIFNTDINNYEKYLGETFPGNVIKFNIAGFSKQDALEYYRKANLQISDNAIEKLNNLFQGRPLLHYLSIRHFETIQSDYLQKELDKISSYTNVEKAENTVVEWILEELPKRSILAHEILMTMALFWRRFDREMLDFILQEHISTIFPLDSQEKNIDQIAEEILDILEQYQFVKSRPELSNGYGSYLLHDEMLRIGRRVFKISTETPSFSEELLNTITNKYYPLKIKEFNNTNNEYLETQYIAERFGYVIQNNVEKGLQQYSELVDQAKKNVNYPLEELLWTEIRHLILEFDTQVLTTKIYNIAQTRADWLFNTLQYEKAISQYEDIISLFPNINRMFNQGRLGHSYLRIGEYEKARQIYASGIKLAAEKNDIGEKIAFKIHIGVLYLKTGDWNEAHSILTESNNDALTYIDEDYDRGRILYARANYYIGNILSLQGKYVLAEKRCEESINILTTYPASSDLMNAYHYMGVAFRYQKNLSRAIQYLETALYVADQNQNIGLSISTLLDLGVVYLEESQIYRYSKDFHNAFLCIKKAYDLSFEGLILSREKGLSQEKAIAFGRLSRVYGEIYKLSLDLDLPHDIENLRKISGSLVIPEEEKWVSLRKLSSSIRFNKLDYVNMAERLLELSFLEADEINDIHRALQSLMELSQLEIDINDLKKTKKYIELMEDFRGDSKEQEELFYLAADMARGILFFLNQKDQEAVRKLSNCYITLAQREGYAQIILDTSIEGLRSVLFKVKPNRAIKMLGDIIEITSGEKELFEKLTERLLNYQREFKRIEKENRRV